jgi:hypothetical protein
MIYLAEAGPLAAAGLTSGNSDLADSAFVGMPLLLAFGGMLPAGHNTARRDVYRFRQPARGGPFRRPAPEWRPW